MAITDYKVSEAYSGRDISSLSDRPNADGLSASALKARFDQLGKEVIPKYNDLIDFIETNLFSGGVQTGHTHNMDILEDGVTNRLYTNTEKTKLGAIAEGAEVNQNAFSGVKVGATTLNASTKTDTFELVEGLNINILVDSVTKKITLSATGDIATEAIQSLIEDLGNYYTSLNVEGALQEVGYSLANEVIKPDGTNSNIINLTFNNGSILRIDGTLNIAEIVFPDGTTMQIGSELWYAEGKAVGAIANGDNVMLAGSQGMHYLVKKAVASELAINPHLYLGVATNSYTDGQWVKVTRWGLVNGINTTGLAFGSMLFFDPVTLGFTTTLPSLPNARIEVGMVVREDSVAGVILVIPDDITLYTNAEIDALLDDKADTSHVHSGADITSGAVAVARGGTGSTTAGEALIALGAAPSTHSHEMSDVIDLSLNLSLKAPLASPTFTGTPTISGSGRVISNDTATGTAVYEIWSGTQAQYDAIGTKDANTLYFIV